MVKIYLVDNEEQAILLRKLNGIQAKCGLMAHGYQMPETTREEHEAVLTVIDYCKRNIAKQLKSCKKIAKLSSAEDDETYEAQQLSPLVKITLGSCCVLVDDTEKLLKELQQLGLCKTVQEALQEALKTNKNLFLMA
ncbi:MAG: hypothetical protein K2J01_01710 [Clostridiales bacterium]|nr:hypothetical protein [Clostridiales bacterium]